MVRLFPCLVLVCLLFYFGISVSPHVQSSFPPVWLLLPPLCFSAVTRCVPCVYLVFKPSSFLCYMSDHSGLWWVVSCVLPVFFPVLPASPVFSVFFVLINYPLPELSANGSYLPHANRDRDAPITNNQNQIMVFSFLKANWQIPIPTADL